MKASRIAIAMFILLGATAHPAVSDTCPDFNGFYQGQHDQALNRIYHYQQMGCTDLLITSCVRSGSGTLNCDPSMSLHWKFDGKSYAAGVGLQPCNAYSECRSYTISPTQITSTDKSAFTGNSYISGHGLCPSPVFTLTQNSNRDLVMQIPATCADGYSTILQSVFRLISL
jgi:hypothetical protein